MGEETGYDSQFHMEECNPCEMRALTGLMLVFKLVIEMNGVDMFQLSWTKLLYNKRRLLNNVCSILAMKDSDDSVMTG